MPSYYDQQYQQQYHPQYQHPQYQQPQYQQQYQQPQYRQQYQQQYQQPQYQQNQIEMKSYGHNNYDGHNSHDGHNNHDSNNTYTQNDEYTKHYYNKYDHVDTSKMSYSQYAKHLAKRESSKAYNSLSASKSFKSFNAAFDNNPSLSEKAKVGLKIFTAIAIIAVIVVALYYFVKLSIKAFRAIANKTKDLLDEATANGLNPIQWMVDPFGSMLNLMGYFWKSFWTLITGGWVK